MPCLYPEASLQFQNNWHGVNKTYQLHTGQDFKRQLLLSVKCNASWGLVHTPASRHSFLGAERFIFMHLPTAPHTSISSKGIAVVFVLNLPAYCTLVVRHLPGWFMFMCIWSIVCLLFGIQHRIVKVTFLVICNITLELLCVFPASGISSEHITDIWPYLNFNQPWSLSKARGTVVSGGALCTQGFHSFSLRLNFYSIFWNVSNVTKKSWFLYKHWRIAWSLTEKQFNIYTLSFHI